MRQQMLHLRRRQYSERRVPPPVLSPDVPEAGRDDKRDEWGALSPGFDVRCAKIVDNRNPRLVREPLSITNLTGYLLRGAMEDRLTVKSKSRDITRRKACLI